MGGCRSAQRQTAETSNWDPAGDYLGSGHAPYADEEHADNGATPLMHGTGEHDDTFTIAVPSDNPLPGAASAILTVPQLVNEADGQTLCRAAPAGLGEDGRFA